MQFTIVPSAGTDTTVAVDSECVMELPADGTRVVLPNKHTMANGDNV
jgi:hypothetical protein